MGWDTSEIFARLDTPDGNLAWNKLTERFRKPIVHMAERMGLGNEEAEDTAQETLIALLASIREGRFDRSQGRASTWLFGIALRQILNARRKRAVQNLRFDPGKSTSFWSNAEAARSDTALWAREWKRSLLDGYLEQVRGEVAPETFQAFELVARAQRPPAEVAASLGITVRSVYNAKHRVLKRIRELREAEEESLFEDISCIVRTREN